MNESTPFLENLAEQYPAVFAFTEQLTGMLDAASGLIWGLPLIILLLGTGLLLTIRLGFIQFRKLGSGMRIALSKPKEGAQGDISHFRALMTALAATIGTGNIAGVATAITLGGPGAVFWMWVTGLVGMATKYGEALLAVKYRVVDANGEMAGGPMYALEYGLGQKWLGVLFAIFGSVAAFGIGNMVQANSVADALHSSFSFPFWATGLILATMTAAVVLGGIQRIGAVTGYLVPFMAAVYMLCGLVILLMHIADIPAALWLIVSDAFTGTAAAGGFAGAAIQQTIQSGVSRGVFSNESGLGSAPIAAAAAKTPNPKTQALVSMTGTFIDTLVVCTMTALILICSGVWDSGLTGAELTVVGFREGFPGDWAGMVVSTGIVLFAFSTILGWGYYGEKCVEYLFGVAAIKPYRVVWSVAVMIGALVQLDLVWSFADVMNGLMAVPNLIALILLSGIIVKESE